MTPIFVRRATDRQYDLRRGRRFMDVGNDVGHSRGPHPITDGGLMCI